MRKTTKHNEMNREVSHMSFSQMLEAIAKGVELRLAHTVVAKIVTLETIYIARELDVPEEDIKEWRSLRFHKEEISEASPFITSIREMGKKYFKLLSITNKEKKFI
jgi:hypothetical protein